MLDDLAADAGVPRDAVAFLDDASSDEIVVLRAAIQRARAEREAELGRAVDRALAFVPWPLRRQIRRLLGG